MSAASPTAVTSGSTPPTASARAKDHVNNAYGATFRIPTRLKLDQFDESDWGNWSSIMEAILTLHEADDILRFEVAPNNIPVIEWESVQRRTKAYLRLYIKPDVTAM